MMRSILEEMWYGNINEDVLERTIHAAFKDIDEASAVMEETCAELLEAGNHVELEQAQQNIIIIQEAVLALHKT